MPNQQVDTIMTAASDHREIMCTGNRPQPLLATNNNNNIIVSIDRLYGKKTCLWTDDGGYCLPRGGPERRKKKRLQGWRRRRSRPTWHTRQEIYSVEGWPPPPQNHIHKLHCSAFVGVPGNTVGGHLILYRTGGLKRRNPNASQVFTNFVDWPLGLNPILIYQYYQLRSFWVWDKPGTSEAVRGIGTECEKMIMIDHVDKTGIDFQVCGNYKAQDNQSN